MSLLTAIRAVLAATPFLGEGHRKVWARLRWQGVRTYELKFLGIASSPAFVREPEGTGVAERFLRTLTEQRLWVRTFETVEALRQALRECTDRYNRAGLCERHGHQTPAQVPRPALPEGRVRPTGPARRDREGRRGAQSALEEGGRCLGLPQNLGHPAHQPVTINSVSTKSGAEQRHEGRRHPVRPAGLCGRGEAYRRSGLEADTPVHEYEPKTWGPSEVDQVVSPAGGWHDPIVTGGSEVEPLS